MITIYYVRNLDPGLWQVQQCGGIKPFVKFQTSLYHHIFKTYLKVDKEQQLFINWDHKVKQTVLWNTFEM
jgi:hypothetical protein